MFGPVLNIIAGAFGAPRLLFAGVAVAALLGTGWWIWDSKSDAEAELAAALKAHQEQVEQLQKEAARARANAEAQAAQLKKAAKNQAAVRKERDEALARARKQAKAIEELKRVRDTDNDGDLAPFVPDALRRMYDSEAPVALPAPSSPAGGGGTKGP